MSPFRVRTCFPAVFRDRSCVHPRESAIWRSTTNSPGFWQRINRAVGMAQVRSRMDAQCGRSQPGWRIIPRVRCGSGIVFRGSRVRPVELGDNQNLSDIVRNNTELDSSLEARRRPSLHFSRVSTFRIISQAEHSEGLHQVHDRGQ
jgi:hypothetical protein